MIMMRKAGKKDVDIVFGLSNDPEVRKVSFSQESIPYSDHVRWFNEKIVDPECLFFLFFVDSEFAAQIRIVRENDSVAELSISVIEAFRGRGVAAEFMKQAVNEAKRCWGVSAIRALVKKENSASNRFFVKVGYALDHGMVFKGQECNVYLYRY